MRLETTAIVLALVLVTACTSSKPRYEYAPDMVDSLAYESFSASPVTRDGKTMLAPAPGTIARGAKPFRYDPGPGEAARAGRELVNPVQRTDEALARARRKGLGDERAAVGIGQMVASSPTLPINIYFAYSVARFSRITVTLI